MRPLASFNQFKSLPGIRRLCFTGSASRYFDASRDQLSKAVPTEIQTRSISASP